MRLLHQILIFLLIATLSLQADVLYHYQFDEEDSTIIDSGPAKCHGTYIPAADKDNDTPETSDPKRYRQDAPGGRALGFFPDLASYVVIPNFQLSDKTEELHIYLVCKVGERSIQYLLGNKTDTGLNGFSLMRWGNHWRFQYGDGKESYCAQAPIRTLAEYMTLEVDFLHNGLVIFKENGSETARIQLKETAIAGGKSTFLLGNYPGSNKRAYQADCFIDELLISNKPITKKVQVTKPDLPAIRCVLVPIEGNEVLFEGKKVLHSFAGHPVPATWILTYEDANVVPVLEWILPDGVSIPEAFRSKRNAPRKCYRIQYDGSIASTIPGELETALHNEEITVAFDSKKDAVIRWRLRNGNVVLLENSFELKILPEMPSLPPGRFHSHSWLISDLAFFSTDLLDRVADSYVRSGLTGKGRFYRRYQQQVAIDERLRDQFGFTLWDVSLWGGPLSDFKSYPETPQAKTADGQEAGFLCPTAFIQDSQSPARNRYELQVSKNLQSAATAALDFEPWGMPAKGCFCERCIRAFNNRFHLSCTSGYEIRNSHPAQWSLFWVEISEKYIGIMATAARKSIPDIQLLDYTYCFPYNSQEELEKRWWGIPKDPRRNEVLLDGSLLSLYHINGREAFEQLELSRHHLKKKIIPISLISRNDPHTGSYTPAEDVLSPQQIFLKSVMTGALGIDTFAIYPGSWIDGAFHVALNQATTQIRLREEFYLDGKRRRDISVKQVASSTPNASWVATVHENNGGKKLATIINFSINTLDFTISDIATNISVNPLSVTYHIW